jgi:hypothetical protein
MVGTVQGNRVDQSHVKDPPDSVNQRTNIMQGREIKNYGDQIPQSAYQDIDEQIRQNPQQLKKRIENGTLVVNDSEKEYVYRVLAKYASMNDDLVEALKLYKLAFKYAPKDSPEIKNYKVIIPALEKKVKN